MRMKKPLSIVLLALVISLPAQADRIHTTGFEEDNLAETMWDSAVNSPTIITTSPHSGTYVLETISGGLRFMRRIPATPYISGTLFGRIYFYHVSGTVDSFGAVARFNNNSTELGLDVQYNPSSRVLKLVNTITTTADTGTFVLSTGTWYRLEFRHLLSETVGEMELKIYTGESTTAEETLSITGEDTLSTNVNRFILGNRNSLAAVFRFDDIAVNDDSGTFQNSWPGPGKIFLLEPSGDNTITWDRVPTDTTNWDRIDDLPGLPDDSTTYIHTTTNETDKLDMSNLGVEVPSDADIILLDVYGRVGSDGTTGARTIDFELWDEADSQNTLLDVSTDINGWRICDTDKHLVFDAGSRTKANVDSFRVGYSRSQGGSNTSRITAQWVNVEWTEAVAAPAFRPKVVVY